MGFKSMCWVKEFPKENKTPSAEFDGPTFINSGPQLSQLTFHHTTVIDFET